MFVDACALVSLLSLEASADTYATALSEAARPWTSIMAAFEAILVLARPEKLAVTYIVAEAVVSEFLTESGIELRD